MGAPRLCKQGGGETQPERNTTHAKAEGCVNDDLRADKLRKGWGFRVGTWNIDSLTGRAGELVDALAERRLDVACVQETRWRGSGCKFFGKKGKVFPYSLPSVGPGADPGVQAVSPQVT